MVLLADSQARAAVSQASIDELAAEFNAEALEQPKVPDEVRQAWVKFRFQGLA